MIQHHEYGTVNPTDAIAAKPAVQAPAGHRWALYAATRDDWTGAELTIEYELADGAVFRDGTVTFGAGIGTQLVASSVNDPHLAVRMRAILTKRPTTTPKHPMTLSLFTEGGSREKTVI